jgi:hypothetical protein
MENSKTPVGRTLGLVLIFAPSPFGRLAEHAHYQASDLARRGFEVRVLCQSDFVKSARDGGYIKERRLLTFAGSGLKARLARALLAIANRYILAWRIIRLRPKFVLLQANSEFHAPLWFLPLWLLGQPGGVGADPDRLGRIVEPDDQDLQTRSLSSSSARRSCR